MADDDGRWPSWAIRFPKVTISAFAETGQAESSIIVPLQRVYTGRRPVISCHLADTLCATLGVWCLLDLLNSILGTSYTSDTPSLFSLLEECIANNYDFGTAYGLLRRIWYTCDWSTIRAKLCRWEEEDREMRRKAVDGNRIINPNLRPRRVWDLYSNRVVPCWCMCNKFHQCCLCWPWPISHGWMDEKDRVDVWTPINRYEWPVPIPKDANLDLVRIEMLNLRVEYTWLDVLCLRQVGGPGEDMRAEEWKLDVPTIGAVYQTYHSPMVWYLSGLGRPLSLKEGDLESDRSWFRRAWTLQEIGNNRSIAGDTPDGPMHARCEDGKYETELLARFHGQLQAMCDISMFRRPVFEALESMQNRVSTNPVDKVAGLAFLLGSRMIPVYSESQSLEEAWTALINSASAGTRTLFFFSYPEPGNAGAKWRPSWDQLMTKPLPTEHLEQIFVHLYEKIPEDLCEVPCIENGLVRGLAAEGGDRRGELIVKSDGGIEHAFEITVTHEYPIPDGTYTLILSYSWRRSCQYCVVGQSLPGKRFEKVSVLKILNFDETDERVLRYPHILHVAKWCRYILV